MSRDRLPSPHPTFSRQVTIESLLRMKEIKHIDQMHNMKIIDLGSNLMREILNTVQNRAYSCLCAFYENLFHIDPA